MNIDFTPEAKTTINAMNQRVNEIRAFFGEDSEHYRKASDSLRVSLVAMIGLGGRISSDGELSLFGSNEFIAYGVNFSRLPIKGEHAEIIRNFGKDPDNFVGTWSVNS